jgi:hypothetical protein
MDRLAGHDDAAGAAERSHGENHEDRPLHYRSPRLAFARRPIRSIGAGLDGPVA